MKGQLVDGRDGSQLDLLGPCLIAPLYSPLPWPRVQGSPLTYPTCGKPGENSALSLASVLRNLQLNKGERHVPGVSLFPLMYSYFFI